MVINSENYHALETLTYAYAGKVDCIYIVIWIESQYVFYVLIDCLASDRLIVKNHEYI